MWTRDDRGIVKYEKVVVGLEPRDAERTAVPNGCLCLLLSSTIPVASSTIISSWYSSKPFPIDVYVKISQANRRY